MGKRVDYFRAAQVSPPDEICELAEIDTRMVPAYISGLYTYTTISFWQSEADYIDGYNRIAIAIERLLMPCGKDIVNNIIALRGIDPAAPRDEIYGTPLTSPQGSTLLDVFNTLQGERGTPGAALDAIATAAEQTRDATTKGLGIGDNPDDLVLLAQLLAVL